MADAKLADFVQVPRNEYDALLAEAAEARKLEFFRRTIEELRSELKETKKEGNKWYVRYQRRTHEFRSVCRERNRESEKVNALVDAITSMYKKRMSDEFRDEQERNTKEEQEWNRVWRERYGEEAESPQD